MTDYINNRILFLKKKLEEDEKNYIRKNIKTINKKYIKLRYYKLHTILDTNALKNGISPSSNHADDSTILIRVIIYLKEFLGISSVGIHDSIGTEIEYSPITKIIFKKETINFLNELLETDTFPFDLLRKEFNNPKKDERIAELENMRKKLMERRDLDKI